MFAVIYDSAGSIVQTIQGAESSIAETARAMGLPWLKYEPPALAEGAPIAIDSLDATHRVVDGAVVLKSIESENNQ